MGRTYYKRQNISAICPNKNGFLTWPRVTYTQTHGLFISKYKLKLGPNPFEIYVCRFSLG